MISYIAYAADSQIRYEATSGGVGSAIIKYLFDNQIIQTSITFDYDCNSLQYVPRLIYSYDEYRITGSIYHEIRLIQFIKDNLYKIRGGFACFVLPCQTLAIRTILEKKGIRSILIGLTCSSQQNIGATCYLLKRMRIKERDVERIQYRGNGWPSGIQIKLKNKKEIFVPNNNSIWTDIFHSRIFVMPRCLRCHETISNKVDIALADPWIRAFVKNDNIGNTLCFIMTDVGNNIFDSDKIEAAAPKEEPARQYYFIGIAREMLKAQFEADVSPLFQSKLKTGCRSYFTVEIVGNPFEFRVGRLDRDTRAPRQLELVGQDLHLFGLWNECQRICRRFVLLCTGHTPYEQSRR